MGSASTERSARARPTSANHRDARLVRRDQTDTTKAEIVARAHEATSATLLSP
jgi:hypothetical protein